MLSFLNEIKGGGDVAIVIGIAMILTVIISLSLHEFGHAYVAYLNGDMTPKAEGRLSINPLRHLDPIGLICCFLFGFGWAKPVNINPLRFRKYRKGLVLTSIAGVTVNLLLAFICPVGYLLILKYGASLFVSKNFVYYLALFGMYFFLLMSEVNVSLAIFNILPIYPLDGFRVVDACTKYGNKYVEFMRRYGSIVLLIVVLLFSPILSMVMDRVFDLINSFWLLII